jgi:hypothetical protein
MTLKRAGFQSLLATINLRQLFLIPYLSAGIFSLIAVSFYRPLLFDNFYEAFVFPMFLPTLILTRQIKSNKFSGKTYSFEQHKSLIISGLTLFILFCLTMGQGLKQ